MVVTTRVRLDRIASSTKNAALMHDVIVGDEIVAAEGYVLAVRILTDKSTYNTVEDLSGRMVRVHAGDVLAGTLGARRALRGYAGEVPKTLAVGDTIDVLNLGGILGRCTSANPEIGPPFRAEVLGAVLAFPELGDRIGRPATIRDHAVPPADELACRIPVVYVAGTCMNAGKTVAATELVRGLTRAGHRVGAVKLTGVSLMRDALSMLDAGAVAALTFNDAGAASTHAGMTVPIARGLFNRVADPRGAHPDVIVAELGDGILGEYGVQDILARRRPDGARRGVRDGGTGSGGLLGRAAADAAPVPSPDHRLHRAGHGQRGRSELRCGRTRRAGAQRAARRVGPGDVRRPRDRRLARRGGGMKVAVLGGAGYVGGELLRLLLEHPDVTELVATSRSQAGRPIAEVHPALQLLTEARFASHAPADAARGQDVVFLALEHGESSQIMGSLLDAGPGMIIDLAADFRITDGRLHERYYGAHPAPELVHRFVYGLADVLGDSLRGATHIAAPGCFATAAQLALYGVADLPLAAVPSIFAITGSSGAGQTPRPTTHHPARAHNVFAYAAMSHRHEGEILEQWRRWRQMIRRARASCATPARSCAASTPPPMCNSPSRCRTRRRTSRRALPGGRSSGCCRLRRNSRTRWARTWRCCTRRCRRTAPRRR